MDRVLHDYFHGYTKGPGEFKLNELNNFEQIEVIQLTSNFWAAQIINKGGFDEILFLEFYSQEYKKPETTMVRPFMYIQGFSKGLREGRHTYFPDNGYMFYLSADNMRTAMDHCQKYFDMD